MLYLLHVFRWKILQRDTFILNANHIKVQPDKKRLYMTQDKNIISDIPYQFTMSVRHKYFEMIKSGQKDIELRAYDEKRKKMKAGDKFLLYDAENPNESIICEILNMHVAPNFESLFKKLDIKRSGFQNMKELIDTVTKFVSHEELQREQVVGIEIKRVK